MPPKRQQQLLKQLFQRYLQLLKQQLQQRQQPQLILQV